MLYLKQIYDILKLVRKTFLTNFFQVHYSQFGEDVLLKEIIDTNVTKGFYVDVGCFHPKKFSNTYMLYRKGWHGINIDMEEDKIFCFRLARPKDYNVLAAVSNKNELVTIYRDRRFSLGATINETLAKETGTMYETTKTRTMLLNDIIENSPFRDKEIDLLSIDAEGHDWEVLQSIDISKYKPKVILIEALEPQIESIVASDLYHYLKSAGYMLYSWVDRSLIFIMPNAKILKGRV